MGGRAEDMEIDVLFLFHSLFVNDKFSTFGPPGMEGDSRKEQRIYLQVMCGGGRGGRTSLMRGGIMDIFHAI